jgi:hypothetical protein
VCQAIIAYLQGHLANWTTLNIIVFTFSALKTLSTTLRRSW